LVFWVAGGLFSGVGRGGGVGEIALLPRGPRTATVIAVTEVHGYAIDAATFLAAIAGPAAAAVTERMAEANLQRSAAALAQPGSASA
jgi:CRP-like cAMP-binding protein